MATLTASSCGASGTATARSSTGPCAGQPPGCGSPLGTASSLAAAQWSALPAAPIAPRSGQAAVWTGKDLLVWGGSASGGVGYPSPQSFADGAAYDPTAATWQPLPPAPLRGRGNVAAVWAGSEALFWGGSSATGPGGMTQVVDDGAAYDPTTRAWQPLPPSPLTPRSNATAIWTGHEAVLFGGRSANGVTLLDGATYNPTARRWGLLPTLPVLHFRNGSPVGATAVWTGRELAVWVTYQVLSYPAPNTTEVRSVQQAVSWVLGSSSWRRLPPPPTGVFTFGATGLWNGTKVLLFNGSLCLPSMSCPPTLTKRVSSFDPSTNTWGTIPSNVVASAAGPMVWTGRAVVALNAGAEVGGSSGPILSPGDGVVLDPSSGAWTSLPHSPLSGLSGASICWTGSQILVWGGFNGSVGPSGEALTAATSGGS